MKNNRKESLKCKHIKSNGQQCKALASKKTGLCAVHAGSVPRLGTKIDPDKGIVHIKKYLVRLMIDTRKGKVSPMVANSISNITDKLIKCHEIIDTDEKIKELRELLERKNSGYDDLDDLECLDLKDENPKRLKR